MIFSVNQRYEMIIVQVCILIETVSKVSDVAHGPLGIYFTWKDDVYHEVEGLFQGNACVQSLSGAIFC